MSKRRSAVCRYSAGAAPCGCSRSARTDAEANRSAALSSDSIRDRKPPSVRARHGSMLRHTVRRTFAGVRRVVSVRLLPGTVRTGVEANRRAAPLRSPASCRRLRPPVDTPAAEAVPRLLAGGAPMHTSSTPPPKKAAGPVRSARGHIGIPPPGRRLFPPSVKAPARGHTLFFIITKKYEEGKKESKKLRIL